MEPIRSVEGWFVLHLYYNVDRRLWSGLDAEEKRSSRERFNTILEDFRRIPNCQAYTYSVWGHKSDIGVMLVDPDLDHLNQVECGLRNAFPAGILRPVHSFTSMSEISEYVSQDKDYDRTLREKEGLDPESNAYREKMEVFRRRMQSYVNERLYPQLPSAHKVMCFYPMNKARRADANWYQLDFDQRKRLMSGHMITGRKFAGKVRQLITGSVGLDDWEWGVTLFVDDPLYLKQILYQMRYDEVSAVYGEFGEFLVGVNLTPQELFDRVGLA